MLARFRNRTRELRSRLESGLYKVYKKYLLHPL